MIGLIGKSVIAIRGIRTDGRTKRFDPQYIMFDDGETFIEFQDQDYYSYHDCDTSAKTVDVWRDKHRWESIMGDLDTFPNATESSV